jgi:hypothetical protein
MSSFKQKTENDIDSLIRFKDRTENYITRYNELLNKVVVCSCGILFKQVMMKDEAYYTTVSFSLPDSTFPVTNTVLSELGKVAASYCPICRPLAVENYKVEMWAKTHPEEAKACMNKNKKSKRDL